MTELKLKDDRKDRQNRSPLSPKLRYNVLRRDGFTCQYCGRTGQERELEIDHIIPVSKGGTNDVGNLQTACKECNRGKLTDEIISQYTEVKIVEKIVYKDNMLPGNFKSTGGVSHDHLDFNKKVINDLVLSIWQKEKADEKPPSKEYIIFCKERMEKQGEEIKRWANDTSFPALVLVCKDVIKYSKFHIDACNPSTPK